MLDLIPSPGHSAEDDVAVDTDGDGRLSGAEIDAAPARIAERAVFARAKDLWDDLNARGFGLDTLSMGMSDDLDAAIAAGSTMVRVGRAVFGHRPLKDATAAA